MPIVLAIETSQRRGSVALRDAAGVVRARELDEGRRAAEALMPAIDALVREAELAPQALEVVGVSIGPGGFTGLRIAVSTAKMLALALNVRIVPVPSTAVVAESCDPAAVGAGPIMIALAAKRETFWAERYRRGPDGHWTSESPGALVDTAGAPLAGGTAVLGDEHVPAALVQRCADEGIPIVAPVLTATACLAVTLRRLDDAPADPRALVPLYPRPPEAVRLWLER